MVNCLDLPARFYLKVDNISLMLTHAAIIKWWTIITVLLEQEVKLQNKRSRLWQTIHRKGFCRNSIRNEYMTIESIQNIGVVGLW